MIAEVREKETKKVELFAASRRSKVMGKLGGNRPMTTTASWISRKPDCCGGDACVRDLRIPVWVLVNYRRLGLSDSGILQAYPLLTAADLEAAKEYAAANPEEIEQAIRKNEVGEAGFVE